MMKFINNLLGNRDFAVFSVRR